MKILSLLLLVATVVSAQAAPPVVSNVRAAQRAGTHYVDIYYNVSSANSPLTVYMAISADGGATLERARLHRPGRGPGRA